MALIGGGAIVLIVVLLLGVGWFQTYQQPYGQTVISVGSLHVSLRYYIKRMAQIAPEFSSVQPEVAVSNMPQATTNSIETDLIVLQRADRLGVSVTSGQIDAAIANDLGMPSSDAPYSSTRPAFESALNAKLSSTGFTQPEYRQYVQAQTLSAQVKSQLASAYPKTAPAAQYETITAPDQATVQKWVDRLNSGTDWETIVSEVHNNPSSGAVQQSDFQTKLQIDDKLVDPLMQLDPGGHTGVITTTDGKYEVARLIAKDDQHPVTSDQLSAITPRLYSDWLVDMKQTLTVKDAISDTQKVFAIQRSGYKPSAQSQSQPGGQPQIPAPQPVNPQQAPQFNPANLPAGISTPSGGFGSGAVPGPAATQGP